jgi:hypothetical protein
LENNALLRSCGRQGLIVARHAGRKAGYTRCQRRLKTEFSVSLIG